MRALAALIRFAGLLFAGPLPAAAQQRVVNVYNWSDYIDPTCSRTSPRRPASRSATTPSTPTRRWRPSCSPASPATTWWCRPPISSSARSRPACSRSSTRRSCRTSERLAGDREAARGLRSRQPIRRQLHVGHDRHRLQRQEGARACSGPMRKIDSWDIVFKPENLAKFKDCGVHMLDSADDILPAALHYLGLDPNSTKQADLEKAADLLMQDPAVGAQIPFVGISQRAGDRRDLPRGRLVGRHQAGAEARRRGQERRRDRLRDPEGRRADVVRQSRDPEGRPQRRRGARLHRLSAAAGRGGEELAISCPTPTAIWRARSCIDKAVLDDQTRLSGRRDDGAASTPSARTTRETQRLMNRLWTRIKTGRVTC